MSELAARLHEATAAGEVLDLRPASFELAELAATESEANSIPAELLVEILATSQRANARERAVRIRGARIVGALELESLESVLGLSLRECFLRDSVLAREARLANLRLSGCRLEEGLDARNLCLRGDLELNAGFCSYGPVDLSGARIEGRVSCKDALFSSSDSGRLPLALNGASISQDVDFSSSVALGEVKMEDAETGGRLILSGTRLLNENGIALNADRTRVGGSVYFVRGFLAEGEVRMLGSKIEGPLVCSEANFRNPGDKALAADRASIGGGIFCEKNTVVTGSARFPSCEVGNQIVFSECQFDGERDDALFLAGVHATDSVGFFEAHITGPINMARAEIAGTLVFEQTRLAMTGQVALRIENAHIGGSALFRRDFKTGGQLSFFGAVVDGSFGFSGESSAHSAFNFENLNVAGVFALEPTAPLPGLVSLTNAKVAHLRDHPDVWAGQYEIDGFQYGGLSGEYDKDRRGRWPKRDRAASTRIEWVKGNSNGYQPQAYEQLARVYKASGHDSRRRATQIAKQRHLRSQLGIFGKAWNVVQDVLVGFGYKTWRVLIPFTALLVFGLIFFSAHLDQIRPENPKLHSPDFQVLPYTLDLLVPVVNLGQREAYVAHHAAQSVAMALVVSGWILTTVFLAALTSLVRRDD